MVDTQSRLEIFIGQQLAGGAAEIVGERFEMLRLQGKTCGHFVAAVLVDLVRALTERLDQIQTLDAAPAAFAQAVFIKPNHDRGPMILMHNP